MRVNFPVRVSFTHDCGIDFSCRSELVIHPTIYREQELPPTGIGGIGSGSSLPQEFVESGAGAPSHRNRGNREREFPLT